MSTPFSNVYAVQANGYAPSSKNAWTTGECTQCGSGVQMATVAYRHGTSIANWTYWMMCASCDRPHLRVGKRTFPSATAITTPTFLPAEIESAWSEVAACLGSGAYTAAAIMSRKILLHVAVEKGLAPANDKGRTPTFQEAVDYLVAEHIITPMMKPWVDQVRTSGNAATHELPATLANEAMEIAEFTQQLLVLVYEMPGRIAVRRSPTDPAAEDQQPMAL